MRKYIVLDLILLAVLTAFVTLQLYFMHGHINFYEIGIYLPHISEFFHGQALYRDVFVLRGPLEILMPAFFMKLFGMHIGVLNAYFYLGTVLTLMIYAFFAKDIFKTRGFLYLFTMVLIARTFPWSCYNVWGGIRFGLGIIPVFLAMDFLRNKKASRLLWSGIFTGIAFWTSFELGIFGFISVVSAIILSGKDFFKNALFYAAGNAISSVPFVVYLTANTALGAYFEGVYIVLTKTSQVFNPALCFDTPMNLREFLVALLPWNHNFRYTLPFLFYLAAGAYLLMKARKKKILGADIAMICLGVYGILMYRSSFRGIEGPSYRMALQPLLLIMFFYVEDFYVRLKAAGQGMEGVKKALIRFLLILVPLYAVLFSIGKYEKRFFIFKEIKYYAKHHRHMEIPGAQPEPTVIKSARAKGIITHAAQAKELDGVVDFINSNTKKREAVFTFPDLCVFNFLTDRPSVSRFYPAELSFMDEKLFSEMLNELKKTRPRFIICAKGYSRLEPFFPTVKRYLDTIDTYLRENYTVRESYSSLNIFERKF